MCRIGGVPKNKMSINSFTELKSVLIADARSNYRDRIRPKVFGDNVWKFIIVLRIREYCSCLRGIRKVLVLGIRVMASWYLHSSSLKLGFCIPVGVCGPGLCLAHYGSIIINENAVIGNNVCIHPGVVIGANGGKKEAPHIGNYVFIGPGAKIIGDITVSDGVCIGANSVVTKSILESGTTWGGFQPAKYQIIIQYLIWRLCVSQRPNRPII